MALAAIFSMAAQVAMDGFQAVVRKMWAAAAAHFEGANVGMCEIHSETLEFVTKKTEVKRRIVGYEQAVTNKVLEARDDFFRRGLAVKHALCNAVNLCCTFGNRYPWINKAVKFGDG